MTKSRGVGRGGARPNTGPKKKPTAPPIERPAAEHINPQERAKSGLALAFATLEHIEQNGVTEGARVAAAKIMIETAIGKPGKGAEDATAKPADKWTDLDEARPN